MEFKVGFKAFLARWKVKELFVFRKYEVSRSHMPRKRYESRTDLSFASSAMRNEQSSIEMKAWLMITQGYVWWISLYRRGAPWEKRERVAIQDNSERTQAVLCTNWHYLYVSCSHSKDRALNILSDAFPGSSGLWQGSHRMGLWPMTLPPTSSESIFKVNYRVQWLQMPDCSLKVSY